MAAALGDEVGLFYDSPRYRLSVGDYLRTPTGRTYLVSSVRVSTRGAHAGVRQMLRCIVVPEDHPSQGDTIYPLFWYRRS